MYNTATVLPVLGLLAASVKGQATKIQVPFNAQVGSLHFPIKCSALGSNNVVLDTVITATAPLFAETGQQISYSDVTAKFTIPQYLATQANVKAGSGVDIRVNVNLNLDNSSPSTLAIFPGGRWINGTKFPTNADTTIKVPASGTLGAIGPVTVGTAGIPHTIQLGAISADVFYTKANGQSDSFTLSCGAQDPAVTIGQVNITPRKSATLKPFAPAVGKTQNFPTTPAGSEYGCFDFTYQCTVRGFGSFPFYLEACGQVAAVAKPGAKFSLTKITSVLQAGEDSLKTLRQFFPRATKANVKVKSLQINSTNATPRTVDVFANKPFNTVSQIPPVGQNLTILIPDGKKVLTGGPFTAGNTIGQRMSLTLGNATAQTQFTDDSGTDYGTLTFVCGPIDAFQLISILITDKVYPKFVSTQ